MLSISSQPPGEPQCERRILVVGLGVAGATLSWQLMWSGVDVTVVDPNHAETTSRAAAGLVTPITGKSMALSWRFPELWSVGRAFYHRLHEATGADVFHPRQTVRLFAGDDEKKKFHRRMEKGGEYLDFIAEVFSDELPSVLNRQPVNAPFGGFVMTGGGWVDTAMLLDTTRNTLESRDAFFAESLSVDDLVITPKGVNWNGRDYDAVVFCQGAQARSNSLFTGHVEFRPAKGEFLTLGLEGTSCENLNAVVNRSGTWICPRGDQSARAGSTYDFDTLDNEPTDAGQAMITGKLDQFVSDVPPVIGASAGVRPVIRQSQPVAGFHPDYPGVVGFFNGLGSKGCSVGPWAAGAFAQSLIDGSSVPDDLDLAAVWVDEPNPS